MHAPLISVCLVETSQWRRILRAEELHVALNSNILVSLLRHVILRPEGSRYHLLLEA